MLTNLSVQNQKQVHQVPFIEEVSNSLYKSLGKQQRSLRKFVAQSSPHKGSNTDLVKVDSTLSIGLAVVESGL